MGHNDFGPIAVPSSGYFLYLKTGLNWLLPKC